MLRDEITRAIHDILDEHERVISAIRHANEAMRAANDAMRRAIDAHDGAIVSALVANRAAIALLNRVREEDGHGQ